MGKDKAMYILQPLSSETAVPEIGTAPTLPTPLRLGSALTPSSRILNGFWILMLFFCLGGYVFNCVLNYVFEIF